MALLAAEAVERAAADTQVAAELEPQIAQVLLLFPFLEVNHRCAIFVD